MVFKNEIYIKEIEDYVNDNLKIISILDNNKILITGASGLIGSYLVDILMNYNFSHNGNIKIYALDINEEISNKRFKTYLNSDMFNYINADISKSVGITEKVDYVIHAASNTSPIDYANHPISTMNTNIIGNYNLLEYAVKSELKRYLFCSSVEVYGKNNGDTDEFSEDYSGYVDCNTVRANYPSSKRACESMCNAYYSEKGVDFVIARIGRIYGPNILKNDTKAPTQFINKALCGEEVVLKSDGLQEYSYCYVGDCVIALLYILIKGEVSNAYNVADKNSRARLKDFAGYAANCSGKNVIFETMTQEEKKSYSTVTKAILKLDKLYDLGFVAKYDLKSGIKNTINILKEAK